jgi:hypothetical protein
MKTKRSTVYLKSDLHQALRLKAAETDQSISDLINGAVSRSLAEDSIDLAAFHQRAKEPRFSFEMTLQDLKKRGSI